MPAKYAPSVKKYDRSTGKSWVEHFYVKSLSTEKLFELLNDKRTKPKHKQKIRNVIQSRGVKIVSYNVVPPTT